MPNERERDSDRQMAESQMADLQNVRVLIEEARAQLGNVSEHRRRHVEVHLSGALRELDDQLSDLSGDLR
jgi:hypothetical protein